MSEWSDIRCREFWDVFRAIVAKRGSETFFFDSRFDESIDDYLGHYEVWLLPGLTESRLAGSWIGLELLAIERLPDVGLRDLPFEIPSKDGPGIDPAACKSGERA